MASQLTPLTPIWHDSLTIIDPDDPVQGGIDGIDNIPHIELAQNDVWLKTELQKALDRITALEGKGGVVTTPPTTTTPTPSTTPTTGGTPTQTTNPAPIEDGVVLFESDTKGEMFTITFDKPIVNSDINAAYFGIYFNGYIRTPTNIKIEDNKLIFNTNYGNLCEGQTLHFTYDSGGRSTGGLKFTDGSAFPTIYDSRGNLKRYAGLNNSTVIDTTPKPVNPDYRLSAWLSPESFSIDNGGTVNIRARIEKLKASVTIAKGMPVSVEIYIGGAVAAGASGAVADSGFMAYIGSASGVITETEVVDNTEMGLADLVYNLGSTREILNSHKCTTGYIKPGKIIVGDYSQWGGGNTASLV